MIHFDSASSTFIIFDYPSIGMMNKSKLIPKALDDCLKLLAALVSSTFSDLQLEQKEKSECIDFQTERPLRAKRCIHDSDTAKVHVVHIWISETLITTMMVRIFCGRNRFGVIFHSRPYSPSPNKTLSSPSLLVHRFLRPCHDMYSPGLPSSLTLLGTNGLGRWAGGG